MVNAGCFGDNFRIACDDGLGALHNFAMLALAKDFFQAGYGESFRGDEIR
jgi:hypothetical protein